MPTTICAIIPTYNRAAMLRINIDAILAQTRPVDEIIVVNDGSTDNTESVVKSYGSRVTLITKRNGGKASALNTGLAHCTADYVWICDDDDIAASDGIEALAKLPDDDPSLDFTMGRYIMFREKNGQKTYIDRGFLNRSNEPNFKILLFEHMVIGLSGMLVRRSFYQKIGSFREDIGMSDDYDMAIRLIRNAKTVYIPKVIYFYRRHQGPRGNITTPLSHDLKIFTWIRDEFQLDEFTPTFALAWEPALRQRAALVQRACVFARRAFWKEAIGDFRQAAGLNAGPATPEELRLVEITLYRIEVPEQCAMLANDPQAIANMRACGKAGAFGHSITQAAYRPLVWQARKAFQKGNIMKGTHMFWLLFRIAGVRGGFARILSSLTP